MTHVANIADSIFGIYALAVIFNGTDTSTCEEKETKSLLFFAAVKSCFIVPSEPRLTFTDQMNMVAITAASPIGAFHLQLLEFEVAVASINQ